MREKEREHTAEYYTRSQETRMKNPCDAAILN